MTETNPIKHGLTEERMPKATLKMLEPAKDTMTDAIKGNDKNSQGLAQKWVKRNA